MPLAVIKVLYLFKAIRNLTWLPWPLIGWDIFNFSMTTTCKVSPRNVPLVVSASYCPRQFWQLPKTTLYEVIKPVRNVSRGVLKKCSSCLEWFEISKMAVLTSDWTKTPLGQFLFLIGRNLINFLRNVDCRGINGNSLIYNLVVFFFEFILLPITEIKCILAKKSLTNLQRREFLMINSFN
jgi:hypothetical protein